MIRKLIALALAGIVLTAPGLAQDAAPAAAEEVGIAPPPGITNEWIQGHYRERTAMFEDREVTPGGAAMLGDSITEWTDWDKLLPEEHPVNFGIAGDIAEGVLLRLDQVKAAQPSKVLLKIGTNDLGQGTDPQEIGDTIEKILDELKTFVDPGDIYVQSVLPREPQFGDAVLELNERLIHEAYMRGMWFVFLHDEFLDEEGQKLNPELTGDGLHLNEAGYALWVEILQPYLAKMPVVPDTDIVIPSHYPPGGKTHFAVRAAMFEEREVAPGKIAFVGDSITEGGDWAALFPELDTVNFGIGWDQTSGVLNRMDQIRKAAPEKIVLMIGTNDIGNGQPVAQAAENVREMLVLFKEFVPADNILVESLPPRGTDLNAEVLELNARLERIAADEGVDFLDIYEPFVVDDHLDPTVTEDMLHFTAAGYERWKGLLTPWLAESE